MRTGRGGRFAKDAEKPRRRSLPRRTPTSARGQYLLSGLLVCNVCKAHYVIADARSYACSGHWNGGACSNHIRVRRDCIERTILGGIRRDLLAPDRVDRMAKEMRAATPSG